MPTVRMSFLLVLVLLSGGSAAAASFNSCSDIRAYWTQPEPSDTYALVQDMKNAVEFLSRFPSSCENYVVERIRWTYADAAHRFSLELSERRARERWANDSAEYYRNYLEWFFALSPDELDNMIVGITHKDRSAPDFSSFRRSWLRTRVGNVLFGISSAYELTGSYSDLLVSFSTIASDCVESRTGCIQVFPLEVVRTWRRWLRTMPDFQMKKTDEDLKRLVSENEDCLQRWAAFKTFLDAYVPANPSAKTELQPVRTMVARWLEG